MSTKAHRSGYIYKKGGLIKSTKKRWLVLNVNELMYYESIKVIDEPPIDRIYLRTVTCAENTFKTEKINNKTAYEFVVKTTTGRDYQMYCETESERDLWVEAINKITHQKKSPVTQFEKVTDPTQFLGK
ncbi:hypothetical protein ABK040_004091 [Willaertia magna]